MPRTLAPTLTRSTRYRHWLNHTWLNHTWLNHTWLRRAPIAALLSGLLLSIGCASDQVRGEAPFAQLSNWQINGTDLRQDLRLRNVNDEVLAVSALRLEVVLDGDTPLFSHEQLVDIEIAPGGFETIALEVSATAAGTAALGRLSDGEIADLTYRLDGTVVSRNNGELAIRREDRIYRVPGRPGAFR